ncbi:MAG: hypothetical protein KIT19_11540 [Phycisphaeraceae bacterium]|nr:hypothetical protein [Phycisphaeraceae bacterium]
MSLKMRCVPNAREARGLALLAVLCMMLSGCGSAMREKQLTRVAKDWCQTIRASQVIPVYPLNEDVKPGDLFIVTTPIPDQARVYRERGFLPLDMHKARLCIASYPKFYHKSHGIGERTDTPYHWIFPDQTATPTPIAGHAGSWLPAAPPTTPAANQGQTPGQHTMPTAFWQAPHAFFPTYSFEVSTQTGLNAAIPIQSVPVSMAWMNATKATGSVQLSDAYVYGVSEDHLSAALSEWTKENRTSLIRLKQANPSPIFVRVVNRVYLIGSINVSLTNATSGRADLGVGSDAGTPGTANPGEVPGVNQQRLKLLSDLASAGTPGAAVSYAYATKRDVVANETFRRPLVVGYIALDYPILPDGDLGEAVATTKTLMGVQEPLAFSAAAGTPTDQELRLYRSAIEGRPSKQQNVLWSKAAGHMPRQFRELYGCKPDNLPNETPQQAFERASESYTKPPNTESRNRTILAAIRKSWDEVFNAAK